MTECDLEQTAYEYIREKLLHGQLVSGDRLRERALAKEFDMSRTPVRHAIRRLERDGLVVHRRNAGSVVRVLSRNDIEELYEVRIELECLGVRKAAERINRLQLRELRDNCDHFFARIRKMHREAPASWDDVKPEVVQEFKRDDLAFHGRIFEIADNEYIARIMQNMEVLSRIFQIPPPRDVNPLSEMVGVWREHRRLLRALACQCPAKADREMANHLTNAMEDHLQRFDREDAWSVRTRKH